MHWPEGSPFLHSFNLWEDETKSYQVLTNWEITRKSNIEYKQTVLYVQEPLKKNNNNKQ